MMEKDDGFHRVERFLVRLTLLLLLLFGMIRVVWPELKMIYADLSRNTSSAHSSIAPD